MSKNKISTLFELLEKYEVEIPIIQRDYAQGRKDIRSEKVRTNLLEDMKAAIQGGSVLDLSFVYGKAEGKKFIPVDGQQRLTTLFLLHLYAFRKDKTKTPLLHKFTYKTRDTSEKFLISLVNNRENLFDTNNKPSEEIKDSEWFESIWEYDPTVQSALVMLDDINNRFLCVDNLSDKLICGKPITFKFLDMEDLGMEDSLYIKLNARGKPLTDFENFKAQLIGRMQNLNLSYIVEFENRFDTGWINIFWDKYKTDFEKRYAEFFRVILMNYDIINNNTDWMSILKYDKIDSVVFNASFETLNFLIQDSHSETFEDARSLIFDATESNTIQKRVLFHAVSTYIINGDTNNETAFKSWLRIIKNLTYNTNRPDDDKYKQMIKTINKLSEHCNDLTEFFAYNENTDLKIDGQQVFDGKQLEEEKIKAQIILNYNKEFADKIYTAESHKYFSGQIRSALYRAKDADGVYNEELFGKYWGKISALFDKNKPKHDNLLRLALLTFGDYTLPVSYYRTLCVNGPGEPHGTPSMKSLFSKSDPGLKCVDIVSRFLDAIDAEKDIEPQLMQMIDNHDIKGTDWRYCFLTYPTLLSWDWMSVSHLRIRLLNGRMHMIHNKAANGYNFDLFLAALHTEFDKYKIKPGYDNNMGTSACHYLSVGKNTISFSDGKFTITDEKNKTVFESHTDNPISETARFIAELVKL
ncbi:MAG: DUF262 domain-containing protein [Oscillospiraceae bacterium]|nr:DUF262 domain-containing protein [Oscillospiraceae bacterium]